ncbi:MAG: HAD family phosphatase [Acidobacteriia bacterium]|nr:HAD family phosphatase [Terriglobia bacterium]
MRDPCSPIRAVLFDFDGTLFDSEYLHHEAWLEAVEPWGVTVGWEDYKRSLVGISDTRACEFFLDLAGRPRTPEAIQSGRERKHSVYRRRALQELVPHPSVAAWIRDNSERVPLGVVSSSAIPDVVPILERQGIADRMRFVICGEHVERLKPDPLPYLLAFEKLQAACDISDPGDCLVFEDSSAGVQAARAAGMTVHVVAEPADLPSALEEWNARIYELVGR